MKTFRFSLVAMIATVLFTACSNEDAVRPKNDETQEISFRLQGSTPEITPRSMATTTLNVDAFVVYGTDNVTEAGTGTNIFDGVTVARQVGGGFDYNPKKYYGSGAVNAEFVAFSPVSANISAPATTSLLTTASFGYEVKVPDNTGDITQEDLLVAGTSVTTIAAAPVHLQFGHALSRIFVKATNGLSENIVITGLSLKNLYSTGTITGTPAAAWTWAWGGYGGTKDYDYILATTGVAVKPGVSAPTLVTSMEQGMMVLPQATANTADLADFDTGDFALEVTYNVANVTGKKAYVLLANGYPFAAGNQYAINIAFSGTELIEISFTIDVDGFGAIANIP